MLKVTIVNLLLSFESFKGGGGVSSQKNLFLIRYCFIDKKISNSYTFLKNSNVNISKSSSSSPTTSPESIFSLESLLSTKNKQHVSSK